MILLHPAIGGISTTHLSYSMPVVLFNKPIAKPVLPRVLFNTTMGKLSPEPAPVGTAPAPYTMPIRQKVPALYWGDFIFQDYLTYEDGKWQQLAAALVRRQHTQKAWQWRVGWQALWDNPDLPIEEYYPGGLPKGEFKCVSCVCWFLGLEEAREPTYPPGIWLPAKVTGTSNLIHRRHKPINTHSFDNQKKTVRYLVHGHLQKPFHRMAGINTSCICIFCEKRCANPGGVLHHMSVHHSDKVHDGEDSWKKDMQALYNVKLHCLILRTLDFLGLTPVNLMVTTWVFNHWDIWAANSAGRIGDGTWANRLCYGRARLP